MASNYLQKFCSEKNIQLIKILDENKRKDTHLILGKDKDNTKIIVKLLGRNATEIVLQSIKNEIAFYKENSNHYLLEFVDSGDSFFIVKFFEGKPLPQIINTKFFQKKYDDSKAFSLIDDLVLMLNWFHNLRMDTRELTNDEKTLVYDSLFDRIGNLVSSGPKGTSKLKFESFLLRQIFKIFSEKLKQKFVRLTDEWESNNLRVISHYGHNDLHCNNILVDKDLTKLKLIDFENSSSPGVWITDTLYFFATLNALFFSKHLIQKKIKEEELKHLSHKEPELNRTKLMKLINLFCLSAEVNSRFRLSNRGLKLNKILAFIFALIRF